MSFDDQVRAVLSRIHDPCSVASGRPTSVIDMGLVRGWTLEPEGVLHVTFCVTFAGCTMAPHFISAAQADLARLPGVRQVVAAVDTAFEWTPDLMSAPGPAMTGTPQAWRRRPAALSDPPTV